MKANLSLAALLCSTIFFSYCSKKDSSPTAPSQVTSLEIKAVDNSGAVVTGATVKLYKGLADITNGTNVQATQTTDASGKVRFTNLSSVYYYFSIEKGCMNNANGIRVSSPLVTGLVNSATIELTGTGTLRFKNNSNNPYRVYVNGLVLFNSLSGNTTEDLPNMLTGNYTIRVLQLSGYVISPTDQTYTGTLGCGNILQTTFP